MNSSGEDRESADSIDEQSAVVSKPAYGYSIEDEYNSIKSDLLKLRKRIVLAIGNGLYAGEESSERDIYSDVSHIEEALARARLDKKSSPEDQATRIVEAKYLLDRAEYKFYRAINGKSRIWRLQNIHALHLFPYVPVILFLIFIFYTSEAPEDVSSLVHIKIGAINAVIWGVVGALFQDIWYLWVYVNRREYEATWQVKYFLAPIVGGILGGVIYLLITAGLIVLSSDANTEQPRDLVVYIVAFFAGYKWEWALKRLEGVSEKFGS